MKKLLIGFFLLACFSQITFAEFKTDYNRSQKLKDHWSPITIFNRTGMNIAYVMMGMYGGAVYTIKKGGSDVYHTGFGDEYAEFEVGFCKQITPNGCDQIAVMNSCSNGHYNANLIKTITVNSLTSCTITCLDGGGISCRQSG